MMKAGRELDALVAEKVMGWQLDENDVYFLGSDRRYLYDEDDEPLPYYSTHIAAAWQVVERFRRGSKQTGVAASITVKVYDGWSPQGDIYISISSPMIPPVEAFSDSIPHAICLAALKAMKECS